MNADKENTLEVLRFPTKYMVIHALRTLLWEITSSISVIKKGPYKRMFERLRS